MLQEIEIFNCFNGQAAYVFGNNLSEVEYSSSGKFACFYFSFPLKPVSDRLLDYGDLLHCTKYVAINHESYTDI